MQKWRYRLVIQFKMIICKNAYRLLSLGYEKTGSLTKAEVLKKSTTRPKRQNKLNQISEDAFRQQRRLLNKPCICWTKNAYQKQRTNFLNYVKLPFLLVICVVLFYDQLATWLYCTTSTNEISELHDTLFTHSTFTTQ